eukprot:5902031-Amphidinium_carterae.1
MQQMTEINRLHLPRKWRTSRTTNKYETVLSKKRSMLQDVSESFQFWRLCSGVLSACHRQIRLLGARGMLRLPAKVTYP